MTGYRQFAPLDPARSPVDAYWINRCSGDPSFDRVLPDGCIDLVFRRDEDGGTLFSSPLIERPDFGPGFPSGTLPRWFVGVRFKPAMARAVIDVPPAECRDRPIPARVIAGAFEGLEQRLIQCRSAEKALALLRTFVDRSVAAPDRETPARVREAVALLRSNSVYQTARCLGTTERSLQRDLVQWAGLPPKTLGRILRMQRTLGMIRVAAAPLADIAARLGYADQAHMTRDLKSLSGYSPRDLRRDLRPVRFVQDAVAA